MHNLTISKKKWTSYQKYQEKIDRMIKLQMLKYVKYKNYIKVRTYLVYTKWHLVFSE